MINEQEHKGKHKSQNHQRTTGTQGIYLKDNRPQQLPLKETRLNVNSNATTQKKNNTGLPDSLKTGVENLSGHSMDDVKVNYNSAKPAAVQAHAYAQGTNIHLGPGQEKHLPHEAWHVVQQKQGRVKPTLQLKGKVQVNDDRNLEKEADIMGAKALSAGNSQSSTSANSKENYSSQTNNPPLKQSNGESEIVQGAFLDASVLGALGTALGVGLGTWLTGGIGAFAAGLGIFSGLVGAFEGMDVEAAKVKKAVDNDEKNNTLEVFYSNSLMGHFTLIIHSPQGIFRNHYVINENHRAGVLGKVNKKIQQLSGYQAGIELTDKLEMGKFQAEYENSASKENLGTWQISSADALKILKSVDAGGMKKDGTYGYVTYSNNVENCGSHVVKALGSAGISVSMPRYKTWSFMPRLIKDNVKKKVKTE